MLVCTFATHRATAQQLRPPAPSPFGPNVFVFDPSMKAADIQHICDAIHKKQERSQFGPERFAIAFKPGTYKVDVDVGFYTHVLGLGKLPDDVVLDGVTAEGKWFGGNVTQNFWRACENLAVTPPRGTNQWAVSQAAPMRRIHVKGNLALAEHGWASGGFLADSLVDGKVDSGPQQQWFSRNTKWSSWSGGVWNMMFLGCTPNPDGTWPARPFTVVAQTPVIREKPFLTIDAGGKYGVFVPGLRKDSTGPSWADGKPAGETIPIEKFYIAQPLKDTAATINAALDKGLNLLLTPGVYKLSETIRVSKPNTVVLGIGLPTIIPTSGNTAMAVFDEDGITVAGVLFDAGQKQSDTLFIVGQPGSAKDHKLNPIALYDIFCRVGGAGPGSATISMTINSRDVIGDHFWIWRADHGEGVGWTVNKTRNGVIVNGDDATLYGLFVEHFHEYQTLWNGERGRTYFYQSELPYDPPSNAAWKHGAVKGYASYKVADNVKTHEAWGLGVYCVFTAGAVIADSAIEVPKTPGVKFHNATSYRLGGRSQKSGIANVINDVGGDARPQSKVMEYPAAK
jgi:hypothetical protein